MQILIEEKEFFLTNNMEWSVATKLMASILSCGSDFEVRLENDGLRIIPKNEEVFEEIIEDMLVSFFDDEEES